MEGKTLLLLLTLATTAWAHAFWLPRATAVLEIPPSPLVPLPTAAPAIPELLRRDEVLTVWFATDNTCGYISGVSSYDLTCNNQALSCALAQTAAIGGVVGCCDAETCLGLETACYGLQEITQGICDDACQSDTLIVKCAGTASPYCITGQFFGGISDYFCGVEAGVVTVLTTYAGETNHRSLIAVTTTIESSSPSPSFSSTSTPTTSPSSSTSVSPTTSSTSSSSATSNPSPTPVGAIVGGVVGGIAVIGIVAGLIIWFFLRNRRNAAKQQQEQQPQSPPQPPSGHQSMQYAQQQYAQPQYAQPQYQQPDPRPQSYYPPPGSPPMPISPGNGSHYSHPSSPPPVSPGPPVYEAPNELSKNTGFQGLYEMPGAQGPPHPPHGEYQ